MTQPNRDMSELEKTLKEYGDGSLVNDIGFIQYLIGEARQKAFSAGEAHGAAKEREKQREYVSSKFIDRQGVYKKFNTVLYLGQETIEDAKLANDYMKAYNDALKEMLEALQGEKKESDL